MRGRSAVGSRPDFSMEPESWAAALRMGGQCARTLVGFKRFPKTSRCLANASFRNANRIAKPKGARLVMRGKAVRWDVELYAIDNIKGLAKP